MAIKEDFGLIGRISLESMLEEINKKNKSPEEIKKHIIENMDYFSSEKFIQTLVNIGIQPHNGNENLLIILIISLIEAYNTDKKLNSNVLEQLEKIKKNASNILNEKHIAIINEQSESNKNQKLNEELSILKGILTFSGIKNNDELINALKNNKKIKEIFNILIKEGLFKEGDEITKVIKSLGYAHNGYKERIELFENEILSLTLQEVLTKSDKNKRGYVVDPGVLDYLDKRKGKKEKSSIKTSTSLEPSNIIKAEDIKTTEITDTSRDEYPQETFKLLEDENEKLEEANLILKNQHGIEQEEIQARIKIAESDKAENLALKKKIEELEKKHEIETNRLNHEVDTLTKTNSQLAETNKNLTNTHLKKY